MRNPKRIDDCISRLKKVWEQYPDLRLSQLIINTLRDPSVGYYMEDDEFLSLIEDYYKIENNQGVGAWVNGQIYCSNCKEFKPSGWFPRYCPYCGEPKNIETLRIYKNDTSR